MRRARSAPLHGDPVEGAGSAALQGDPPRRLGCGLAGVLFAAIAQGVSAAPCTTATEACAEWLALAGQRVRIYRSHALDAPHAEIERALIIVHGQSRNADGYFRYASSAAQLAGAERNTIVIAPKFASNGGSDCRDALAADELNWVCSGRRSWRNGGAADGHPNVTSYHVGDAILERLARKDLFPNLRSIVLAGHSAGGQYTTRYAMANERHGRVGVSIRYVVANPSSYTYPDALRPIDAAFAVNPAGATESAGPVAAQTAAAFATFAGASACPNFDRWPYGLQGRVGYSARFLPEQLIRQLTTRPITFLVGEGDTLPVSGFDASCSAMAQGPNRVARGVAYARYLNEHHGARHPLIVVPGCAHVGRCMLTHERVLPILFPGD